MQAAKTLFNLRWLTLIVALAFFLNVDKAAAQPVLYSAAHTANTEDSVLYRIDPSTGEATEVGPIGFQGCSGMDFDSSWTLYATCTRADGTHALITIDQETGSGTEVGPTGIQLLGAELKLGTDISFRSNGTLFAYIIGIPDYLGTIDTSNGLVSEIGKVNFLELGNGIAFSPDDKLFHVGSKSLIFAGGKLRTLGQEPNAEGKIGVVSATPLNFPSNTPAFINALEFEPRTGILFASLNYGGPESFLAIVNIKNGAVTVIGQTHDHMDAIAFVPVITEAASTPTPTGAPYLKCNKVSRGRYLIRHEQIEVMLENDTGSVKVRVLKPESLCTVLYDNGDVLTESTTTLACYRVKDVVRHRRNGHHLSFEWHHVYIDNEFGEQTLFVDKHQFLCVPSEIKDDKVKIKTYYHRSHRHLKDHKEHNYSKKHKRHLKKHKRHLKKHKRRSKKHKRDDDDDDD